MTLTEEYNIKLKEIRERMTVRKMAAYFDCAEGSIRNWLRDSGSVKIKYAEQIDRLHGELVNG